MKKILLAACLIATGMSAKAQQKIRITNNTCQTVYAFFAADSAGACSINYYTPTQYAINASASIVFDITTLTWLSTPPAGAFFTRARFVDVSGTGPTWGADSYNPCTGLSTTFPVKGRCGFINITEDWTSNPSQADIILN